MTKQKTLYRLAKELDETSRVISLTYPGDKDLKYLDEYIGVAFRLYEADGLKVCHAYWPRACVSGFVTYPSHQDRPTQEQLDGALRLLFIKAVKDSQYREASCAK